MLITPSYQTGTVTNFAGASGTGLLQTLIAFLTSDSGTSGKDWTVEHNDQSRDNDGTTSSYGSTYKEYILSNTGLSGNENILIGMREYLYVSENLYGWELNGYTSVPTYWNSNALSSHGHSSFDSTRKHWDDLPTLQLFDNSMEYWFYSTSEFVFVSVRVSTSYYQCYLGNFVRYGSPGSYPYPLYIAGSSVGNVDYQVGGNGPVRPSDDSDEPTCFAVGPDGTFYSGADLFAYPMQGDTDVVSISDTTGGAALLMPPILRATNGAVYLTLGQLFNTVVYRKTNALSEMTYLDEDNHKFRVFAQGKNDYDYDFLGSYEAVGTTTTTTTTTSTTTTTT